MINLIKSNFQEEFFIIIDKLILLVLIVLCLIVLLIVLGLKLLIYLVEWSLTNFNLIGHFFLFIVVFLIFRGEKRDKWDYIKLLIYFVIQNIIYFHSENIYNLGAYFCLFGFSCFLFAIQNPDYKPDYEERIHKIVKLIFLQPGLFFTIIGSVILFGISISHILEVGGIIYVVLPSLNIDVFVDYFCSKFIIYIIINIVVIIFNWDNKSFCILDYINSKSFLLFFISISIGFILNIYLIAPIFSVLHIQFGKLLECSNVLGLNIIKQFTYIIEFFTDCFKVYTNKNIISNYIRNTWIFHTWVFNNPHISNSIVNRTINIGSWAPSMPKPVLLENKYIYFKDGCRYIKPTVFFECVKKFSPENSYFTSLHVSNFTNKNNFSLTNSCIIVGNHCNNIIKSVSSDMHNLKILIKSVNKVDLIDYLKHNEFLVSLPKLDLENFCSKFISRNPYVSNTPDVRQAIKDINILNYNIVPDINNMFKLSDFMEDGIPITDLFIQCLDVHNNKFRIGYVVAYRLASITYSYPNIHLDIFIMEKFKQDFGHLFLIDYLYVYYPYIPYFDCCQVEQGKIIGHILSPEHHKNNTLNFMIHAGQLNNIDHLISLRNEFLGNNYFDNFEINSFLPLNVYNKTSNQVFFKRFFEFYSLRDASLGMYHHDEEFPEYSTLNYFITNERKYTHIDILYCNKPKYGLSWLIDNIQDKGRDIYVDRNINNYYSIISDCKRILFIEYKNNNYYNHYSDENTWEVRTIHPFMAWRNFTNCNYLNLDINNPVHVLTLNMLNVPIIMHSNYDGFYKANAKVSKKDMNIIKSVDAINKKHIFTADLDNRNASYYIDHVMRHIFNVPCPLGQDEKRPIEACKFIFKRNFGSICPDNWG